MAEEPVRKEDEEEVEQAVQAEAEPGADSGAEPELVAASEADKLKALFREYGQPVLIGLGLAVAVFLGYGAYKNYKQSVALRASQMLMGAQTTEQLQQVVNQYGATPTGPLAVLTLAAQYYEGGQYDLAQFTYTQFEQKYPRHPLKQIAEVGKAQCLEGSGQFDVAASQFDAFIKANPKNFLTPLAILGKARCQTELGQFGEAKATYEDFIAANPKSSWASIAETALLFVDKEMRAQKKGGTAAEMSFTPTAPTPTAPAPFNPSVPATVPGLSLPAATAPAR